MKPTKPTHQTLLTLALTLTLPALSLTQAMAQECVQDADCPSGDLCQLSTAVSVCSVDSQGVESCEASPEPTVGFCYTPPTPCMSDADCGAFTECLFSLYGDDDVPSTAVECAPGSDCEPTMPSPEMMTLSEGFCAPRIVSCQADSECPSSFHCEIYTYEVGCAAPAIACREGEQCDPPAPVDCGSDVEQVTEGTCLPNEIDCDSDAACPTDWRCVQIEEGACFSGGSMGSTGSAGSAGSTDPMGAPEADPIDPAMGGAEAQLPPPMDRPIEDTSCVTTTRSLCVPEGWDSNNGGIAYAQDGAVRAEAGVTSGEITESGEPTSPQAAGADTTSAASNNVESGGCDAAGGRGTAHITLLALALIALRTLSRRARRDL